MRILDWIGEHVDLVGVVTFLAGALVLALFQWLGGGLRTARRRLGERSHWYDRLAHLRTDVSRGYFEQELGLSHAFRNEIANGYLEYIYPHRWFFIQALVDKEDRVIMYSVTSRKSDFEPAIWPTNTSPQSRPAIPHPRLGAVTFADVFPDVLPDGIQAFFSGATAPSFYIESYSVGNPGHYLTYVVGLNDAGHYFFDMSNAYSPELLAPEVRLGRLEARYDDGDELVAYLSQDHVAGFRSLGKPNAYGIIGQSFPGSEPLRVYLGPNRTQVRIL